MYFFSHDERCGELRVVMTCQVIVLETAARVSKILGTALNAPPRAGNRLPNKEIYYH
jgi:hypothetical protein